MTSAPAVLSCGRCRRSLAPEDARRVPRLIRLGLAFALGAMHAGMWLWQELSQPFCARCARRLSVLSALLLVIVAAAELAALKWLLFDWRPSFQKK